MAKRWMRLLVGLLAAAALLGGEYYALTCPLKFHPGLWQRHDGLRDRMLDSLLADYSLPGMDRDEIVALLGEGGSPQQFSVPYQGQTHQVLEEYYYLRDHGAFYADFLVLYYDLRDGNYVCVTWEQKTVDLF